MGRQQYNYEYPPVHPPHPQSKYETSPLHTKNLKDTRYSWLETPIEQKPVNATNASRRKSSVPPLPALPEDNNQDMGEQQPSSQTQAYAQQQPYYQQTASPPRNHYVELLHRPDPIKIIPDHPNYRISTTTHVDPYSPGLAMRTSKPHPQAAHTTTIPTAPSNLNLNTTYDPIPHPSSGGSWSNNLYSCAEPTTCATGLFCPCILYGRTQHRLSLRSQKKDPMDMAHFNIVNGSCMAWTVLCGFNGILSGIQKTRVRRSYGMESGSGNVFSDCLQGCCCCCCVLAQIEKEIKHREVQEKQATIQQGYRPPAGMTYSLGST